MKDLEEVEHSKDENSRYFTFEHGDASKSFKKAVGVDWLTDAER